MINKLLLTWLLLFVVSSFYSLTEPLWKLGSFMNVLCKLAKFIVVGTIIMTIIGAFVGIWML